MPGYGKKLYSRATETDGDDLSGWPVIDFARLQYIGVSLLGYSRAETLLMYVSEICDQFEIYCEANGIKQAESEVTF